MDVPLWFAALRTLGWGSLVLQTVYVPMWVIDRWLSHLPDHGWFLLLLLPFSVWGMASTVLPIPAIVHSAIMALGVTGRSQWRLAASSIASLVVPCALYALDWTLIPAIIFWSSTVLAWAALGMLAYHPRLAAERAPEAVRERSPWSLLALGLAGVIFGRVMAGREVFPSVRAKDAWYLVILGLAGVALGWLIAGRGLFRPATEDHGGMLLPIIYAPFLVAATAGAYGSEVVAKWWARRRHTGEQALRPDL